MSCKMDAIRTSLFPNCYFIFIIDCCKVISIISLCFNSALLGRRVPLRARVQERREVDRGDRQEAGSTGT